jgi:hypothetical protein
MRARSGASDYQISSSSSHMQANSAFFKGSGVAIRGLETAWCEIDVAVSLAA